MYWFVDHGDGWLEENKAGVLLVCERRYDRRCWADRIGKCWILRQVGVHSRSPMDRAAWRRNSLVGAFR